MTTTATQSDVDTGTTLSTVARCGIGVYPAIGFTEYAEIDAINWHKLEPFRKSEKNGRCKMVIPDDATDSQVFGEAFHCAILEPERFKQQYAAMPKFAGHPNSNDHRNAKQAWVDANASSVCLTRSEFEDVAAMSLAVRQHPIAAAILAAKGRNELSIVWKESTTGTICKGRIDRLCRVKVGLLDPHAANPNDDAVVLADFKTTRNIEPFLFNKDRAKYGYHGQMAMYIDGANSISPAGIVPLIIAVQNSGEMDVVVYRLDDDAIENGRRLYRRLLKTYLRCERERDWPGISNQIVPLSCDPWEKESSLED